MSLIVGNWKMNLTASQGAALVRELCQLEATAYKNSGFENAQAQLVICPPFTALESVQTVLSDPRRDSKSQISLGAQDCSPQSDGAHTGDISTAMLAALGVSHVIVGHSERRGQHGESPELVRAKAEAALEAGLTPIICVGEGQDDRYTGRQTEIVTKQLIGSLPQSPFRSGAGAYVDEMEKPVLAPIIAYEPVWAIGTGLAASPEDIKEMHAHLRTCLKAAFPDQPELLLLYGGSVKPDNSRDLLAIANVDGLLIGGASLTANGFWTIAARAGSS